LIPGVVDPRYSPAAACEAYSCAWRSFPVSACREACCPFEWQRAEAEDRRRREEKDAKAKEGGKCL
jgi:hypothetical protein